MDQATKLVSEHWAAIVAAVLAIIGGGFPTVELATAFAAEKEPDEHKICKNRLGQYNTLIRNGRRL